VHYNYHLFDQICRLSDDGIQVQIIFVRGGDALFKEDHGRADPARIKAVSLDLPGIRVNQIGFFSAIKLFFLVFTHVIFASHVLVSTQAPVHSKMAFVAARVLRKRFAVVVEQWRPRSLSSALHKLYTKFGYRVVRGADRVFVHGVAQEEFVIREVGANCEKVVQLPFLSLDPIRELGSSVPREKTILYFGRITRQKGLDQLIVAFRELKLSGVQLVICGGVSSSFFWELADSEKFFAECRELAGEDLSIKFVGEVPPEKKNIYFQNAMLFVHPHSDLSDLFDGWSLVINEAISYGLPVVCSDRVGAASTLVQHGYNGLVYRAGRIDELKTCILELVNNDEKTARFSKHSKRIFNEYHQPAAIRRVFRDFLRL